MNRDEIGSAEWFKKEKDGLLRRLCITAIQAGGFCFSIAIHLAMKFAIDHVLPQGWIFFAGLLHAAIGIIFSAIYLAIGIDILVIYIPALDGLKDALEGKRTNVGDDERGISAASEASD
jgi:hypothetical protein